MGSFLATRFPALRNSQQSFPAGRPCRRQLLPLPSEEREASMRALLAPVFVFTLILGATPLPAQTPNPSPAAPAATTGRTSAGATFSLPPGWTQRNVSSAVIVLDAPENDAHLAIVDITKAADARAAVKSAWQLYRGGESHAFKLLTSLPARNGWEELANVDYETSPNEHLAVFTRASRKGADWTVTILDGNEGTVEKRAGQVNLVMQSLRPAGYSKENFAGRQAH